MTRNLRLSLTSCFILCFALASTDAALGQISDNEQQQIVTQFKSLLPSKWKVTGTRNDAGPFGWGDDKRYLGFRITIESSGSVTISTGEKSGRAQTTKMHPSITVWFIPLSNGITLQQAEDKYRATQMIQMAHASVLGVNNQYVLAGYSNTGSDEAYKVLNHIEEKFKVKTTQ